MREQHLVAVEPITGHKQPAGQSFSDIAARVGQGSIVGLYAEGVGITKQASQQSDALIDCLLQLLCGNAMGRHLQLA